MRTLGIEYHQIGVGDKFIDQWQGLTKKKRGISAGMCRVGADFPLKKGERQIHHGRPFQPFCDLNSAKGMVILHGEQDTGHRRRRLLGSNLCRRLVKDENNMVYCLDNLFTGRMSNIQPLLSPPNFKFIEHDVQEPIDIQVDQIYNAACPASPLPIRRAPPTPRKRAFSGSCTCWSWQRSMMPRFLQFSTSEVYGDPEVHPQVESYRGCVNPIGIRSCYDESAAPKRCALITTGSLV